MQAQWRLTTCEVQLAMRASLGDRGAGLGPEEQSSLYHCLGRDPGWQVTP